MRRSKADTAAIAQASKLIQDFSGHKPRFAGTARVPKFPRIGIAIGQVLGIAYETKRSGRIEKYYHPFATESRPHLVVTPDGSQLLLLGGAYSFTERGIEDMPRFRQKR